MGSPTETPLPTARRVLIRVLFQTDEHPEPTRGEAETQVPALAKPNNRAPFPRSAGRQDGNGAETANVDA